MWRTNGTGQFSRRFPGSVQESYRDDDTFARRVQAAWVAFARTGDPNTPALPAWPAYTLGQRATLLLNCDCSLARDPAGNERWLWEGVG